MAVEEPEARVVRAELDHHVAPCWDKNGVHTRSGGVEVDLWSVALSPPDSSAGLAVRVVEVRLVFQTRERICALLDEPSPSVVVAISAIYHPE